jgi:hypothetical protein
MALLKVGYSLWTTYMPPDYPAILYATTIQIHIADVLTTAFFRRSAAPLFDPYGDGWERQQFSQRHFDDSASMDVYYPGWCGAMPPRPRPLLGSTSTATGKLPAVVLPAGTASSQLIDEIVRLRAENTALTSSSSWRIIAPLRRSCPTCGVLKFAQSTERTRISMR